VTVVHGFTRHLVWHVLSHGKPRMNVVSAAIPVWPTLLLQSSPEHPKQQHCHVVNEKIEKTGKSSKQKCNYYLTIHHKFLVYQNV